MSFFSNLFKTVKEVTMRTLRYSRKSIQSLRIFCKIAAILMLAPWYDFDNKVVKRRKLHKSYNVFVSIVTVVLSWIYTKKSLDACESLFMYILQLLSHCLMMVLSTIVILGSAFWNQNHWQNLFRSFAYLEKCLRTERVIEKFVMRNFNFQALLSHLFVLANLVFCFAVWMFNTDYSPPDQVVLALFNLFLFYEEFFKMFLVVNIAVAIKYKYHDIHMLLKESCLKTGPDFSNSVKAVCHLCAVMHELINIFNRLFGVETFLALLHSCITELSCFCYIQVYYAKPRPETNPISSLMLSSFVSIGAVCLVRFLLHSVISNIMKSVKR